MAVTADDCASGMLEVVPSIMRFLKNEMRNRRSRGLSVPQFRALLYLARHPGAPLREVAAHLGLTPPSTSTLIEALVTAALAKREPSLKDRRMVTITVTEKGKRSLDVAFKGTGQRLAALLAELDQAELTTIYEAMKSLQQIFAAEATPPIV